MIVFPRQASGAATASVNSPRAFDALPTAIEGIATANLARFEAAHLARRFRLAPSMAGVGASLAFGDARQ